MKLVRSVTASERNDPEAARDGRAGSRRGLSRLHGVDVDRGRTGNVDLHPVHGGSRQPEGRAWGTGAQVPTPLPLYSIGPRGDVAPNFCLLCPFCGQLNKGRLVICLGVVLSLVPKLKVS